MTSALYEANLSNRTVFLRADLNVPLSNEGTIIDDFRLEALVPTLTLLMQKQSRLVLGTHLGRPQGYEEQFSTKHLIRWFTDKGYQITWAPSLEVARQIVQNIEPGSILLLENLRFNPGEKGRNSAFAEQLQQLGDYYVNDAWGVLEQEDTSVTLLPSLYAQENKTIGLLIEHEMKMLSLLRPAEEPFVIVMGGAKLKEKLPLVSKALDVATVLLLPPLAFTFMKAQGIKVGNSLIDEELLPLAREILNKVSHSKRNLLLPTDFLIAVQDRSGELRVTATIEEGQLGIALGPQSLEHYMHIIESAKSVFFNGPMGFFERPETLEPLKKLLQSIVQANTLSVVGGGESLAAVKLFGLEQSFTFCSTGGGTTLRYILRGSLPGLTYLS